MTITKYETREEWLAARNSGLGASDVPAALGLSPWKSPFQLWAEKTGLAEEPDLADNEFIEFGLRLEPVVAEAFADRTGRDIKLFPPFYVCQHPEYAFLRCTPDAEERDGHDWGILQIKTANEFKKADWEDEPPLPYQVQLQSELAVTGKKWGTLAVLIGGNKLRWFDQEINQELIDVMIPRLRDFWEMVEKRKQPPVDSTEVTAQVLYKMHPDDNGELVRLAEGSDPLVEELKHVKAKKKAVERHERLLTNQLKAEMGSNTFAVTPRGQYVSWRTQNVKKYTVPARQQRVLRLLSKTPKELQ